MNRHALLALVVVIAAVCFPCVQSSSSSPVSTVQLRSIRGSAPVCSFDATKVRVLQQFYNPDFNNGHYSPPGNNIQSTQISQQMADDINNAFANAPPLVQKDMCALTGSNIFIDSNSCLNGIVIPCQPVSTSFPIGWGFRSSTNPDKGSIYIAIAGSLWPNGGTTTLSSFENGVLQALISQLGNPAWTTPSTISSATPDASWAAVLAALAHELGHAKFNYTIHPHDNYGRDYKLDPLRPCSNYIANFFSGWSYTKDKQLVPKDMWRQFTDMESDDSGKKIDHAASPTLAGLASSSTPNQLLYTLYSGTTQPWASLWGSWSPDEDFVETYVLYALAGDAMNPGNVQHLWITIGGSPYDIIQGISAKPTLQNKIACVANLPTI